MIVETNDLHSHDNLSNLSFSSFFIDSLCM